MGVPTSLCLGKQLLGMVHVVPQKVPSGPEPQLPKANWIDLSLPGLTLPSPWEPLGALPKINYLRGGPLVLFSGSALREKEARITVL